MGDVWFSTLTVKGGLSIKRTAFKSLYNLKKMPVERQGVLTKSLEIGKQQTLISCVKCVQGAGKKIRLHNFLSG